MNNEFWAQLKAINQLNSDTYEVLFSLKDGTSFEFSPGQYIWLHLKELTYPDSKGQRRAFSLTCSRTHSNTLSILFRDTGSGYKKTLLSLQIGADVLMIGPFGSSYVLEDKPQQLVLVSGGVGIAPYLSILRSLDSIKNKNNIILININSSADTATHLEEINQIASRESVNFINHYGKFDDSIFPSNLDFSSAIFFICGPSGMVDFLHSMLSAKGVSNTQLHFEQHYPSVPGNLTEEDFKLDPGEQNIMLQAVQDSRNHVVITDVNGQIVFANSKAQDNTGFTFDEMRGNTPRLWGGMMSKEFYQSFWKKKHDGVGFDGELMNRRKNGEVYYVLAHISPIFSNEKTIIGYIGTEEDITKEKQIDKAKTEFISLASHQLRTPLSTINWYCEMLLSGDAGKLSSEQQKFVEEAYSGSLRMSQLVNALLNVSRIETGTYMINPELINIIQLMRSILDESKPLIDEKKLMVTLVKEDLPEIMLDPSLTTIIFQNLLTNSVKYTPAGGTITIHLRKILSGETYAQMVMAQDSLLIEVTDTGIGIPKTQQKQIFEKLFRADNVRNSNTDGTGLGLYLVKSLIEQCKGHIWFTSTEDKGSTFFVVIPLSGMSKKSGDKKLEHTGGISAYGK